MGASHLRREEEGHMPTIAVVERRARGPRRPSGAPLTSLPQPLAEDGRTADARIPAGLPVRPYDLGGYIPADGRTGDLVHRYYQEQAQIDGGRNDRFVSVSDNGGLVLSYYDAT